MLAITFGCQRFHQYVYGKPFIVETDHQPLETIFQKPLEKCPLRLQRMRISLQDYDMIVKYKPGNHLYLAHAPSRTSYDDTNFEVNERMYEAHVDIINCDNAFSPNKFAKIAVETKNDPELIELGKVIKEGWPNHKGKMKGLVSPYWNVRDELSAINGLIFKGNQAVIPMAMRNKILDKLHYTYLG